MMKRLFVSLGLSIAAAHTMAAAGDFNFLTIQDGKIINTTAYKAEAVHAEAVKWIATLKKPINVETMMTVVNAMPAKDRCANFLSVAVALTMVEEGYKNVSELTKNSLQNLFYTIQDVNKKTQVTCRKANT